MGVVLTGLTVARAKPLWTGIHTTLPHADPPLTEASEGGRSALMSCVAVVGVIGGKVVDMRLLEGREIGGSAFGDLLE